MTPQLKVPNFRRLDSYIGVWAIEPRAAAILWRSAQTINIAAHIQDDKPPTLKSSIEKLTARGKTVATIKVQGTLMKAIPSMSAGTSTVQLRRDIRNAAADPDIDAILLAIDSPGGTVAGTDDLAADIRAARKQKPVWAQIEDLGASAAYWLASQCEKIFANSPTAMVGSIGMLMTIYDMSGMADAQGIKALVYSTGPLKGAGVDGTPVTPEQADYFQGLVDDAQKTFDAAVKKGRGLTDAQLGKVKSGAVFSAEEALDKKLIDGIQSFETTLDALASAARRSNRTATAQPMPTAKGAAMNEFNEWLAANGFEAETMSAQDRIAAMQLWKADPQPTAKQFAEAEHCAEIMIARKAAAAESERQSAIRRLCLDAGNPVMTVDDTETSIEAHAILNGWDTQRTELQILRVRRPTPAIISHSHETDCTLEALQGALLLRAGGRLDHRSYQTEAALALKLPRFLRSGMNADSRQRAMENAHRYSDMSSIDLVREALRLDGKDIPRNRNESIRAAFSGSALTNIFTTSVNAVLLATYMDTGDTTGGWTSSADVADFKTNDRIRLSKGPNLIKLPRGGEADHYDRSDVIESYKIARYAKQFVVDEQDLIDDSMDALTTTPVEMGQAAARLRPDLVYAIILNNAALGADSVALFHADHTNLNTSSALSAATLKVAIAAMEKMQENSVNLNLRVSHLIVPSDLKHLGAELIQSTTVTWGADDETLRGTLNTLNAIENMALVSDSRLSNGVTNPVDGVAVSGSTTTWYIASSMGHNIEVGYLRGTGRAPQSRSFTLSEGKWGMGWDVNLDIGAKALDYRGMQKNTSS